MTQGVSADISASVIGQYLGANDLGTPEFDLNVKSLLRLTPGTAANKADKVFSDTRTLAASATENLDLAGVLTDPFGAALTMAKVRAVLFIAHPANTNNVNVGGAASNGFLGPFADATDVVSIPPGGCFLATAPVGGWTVTPATGDLLKVANSSSGTGVTYDVVIIGTSA